MIELARPEPDGAFAPPLNFLPGPVGIHRTVHEAFCQPAVSHRSEVFLEDFRILRRRLCELAGAQQVQLLLGSGTLANDAVAAQLSLSRERGLVLANGEFGERLAEQARRFGLEHRVLVSGWGQPLPYDQARRALSAGRFRWIWAVHCETSTGVLNDLAALKSLARDSGSRLCLDCISTLGAVPFSLEGVDLATGVSGKGLASYPGLSFVFHQRPIEPAPALPRYLDLGLYAHSPATPFTSSSNLMAALGASLDRAGAPRLRAELGRRLRPRLEALGFTILAPLAIGSPVVITLHPPRPAPAFDLGTLLESRGVLLSYRSDYLVRRNLLQVCLLGEHDLQQGERLLDALSEALTDLGASRYTPGNSGGPR